MPAISARDHECYMPAISAIWTSVTWRLMSPDDSDSSDFKIEPSDSSGHLCRLMSQTLLRDSGCDYSYRVAMASVTMATTAKES